MIKIVLYDPSWPARFRREADALRVAFGAHALRIDHVGSTSVPGLAAKAVIDIQISVRALADLAPYEKPLFELGYSRIPMGDFDQIYPFFQKPATWPSTHHVHLCVAGGEQERKHLAFRDYLCDHPAVCSAYVELKERLAAENDGESLESRQRYSQAKTGFVDATLQAAFAQGYPRDLNRCPA